ncbi:glycosyltransferase family 61 protein [Rhizobium sp. B230/85]|uniref:glycosyltransferase family 61 protein n=1 Tax=unclassified Rhizobium TaxID=2613769 RepID=UPI001AD9D5CA|nr:MULTISPECIES: glycosyltransferase family 61 protein [unclassified Rhizobium]MBO9136823.1 glycosyltransferase family 61 protein [Rhizobium sp. B209b/85]QXZ99003.1 glycosyltransferase family 61 protein [Rhizobium sp. B230/85]
MISSLLKRAARKALNYREVSGSSIRTLSEPGGVEPNINMLVQSGLIDLKYYNLQLDASMSNVLEAARHYVLQGAMDDINPNAAFDTRWYRETYLLDDPSTNPLLDYLKHIEKEQRDPSPGFSNAFYRTFHRDVSKAGIDPLRHFVEYGQFENRITSPFADQEALPSRFRSIGAEMLPQDGVTQFRGTFAVQPLKKFAAAILSSSYHQARDEHEDAGIRESSTAEYYPAAPYVARFESVILIGGSRLVLKDETTALSDEISAFQFVSNSCVRPHTFHLTKAGKLLLTLSRQYPSQIDRGIHVMHEYAENYFHFIVEVLPRLLLADELGLDPSIPLLIQKNLARNLRVLLDGMNINKRPIIELNDRQIYPIHDLYFASDASSIQDVYERKRLPEDTILHLGLIRRVVDQILERYAQPMHDERQPNRKIYVRRGQRYRGLRNETEVEDFLVEQGFELVSTDDVSIRSQINIFRDAKQIICPTGAAVTNILWCRPGTEVNIFMSDHVSTPDEIWTQLGTVSGCNVKITKCERAFSTDGRYAMHDDYLVDLNTVRTIVGEFEYRSNSI